MVRLGHKEHSFMGIDIGTSGCKSAVFSEDGHQLSQSYRAYNTISTNPGWVELDINELIDCCFEVIKEAAGKNSVGTIRGLGISSQGEAFTMIDRAGNALCNAFVSSDIRADSYVKNLSEGFGEEKLYAITGHTPHPMFSLYKLLWVKDNLPHIWDKCFRILCIEDLLQFKLGITNPTISWSLAGRTMMFDVRKHQWSKEIIEGVGIRVEQLSRPVPPGTIAGFVDEKIADQLLIPGRLPVINGGHDQTCSALGAGAINPGTAVYASGTVECITPSFSMPIFNDRLRKNNFCTYDHAVQGMYATVAFNLTGGNLLKWFLDEFGKPEIEQANRENADPYELMLSKLPPEPTNLLALPYFTPSGTPYFDTTVKAAIIGMDLSTKREHILKALMEGLAFEVKLNLEILAQSGYIIKELRAIGGGSRSDVLNQLRANIINRPITALDITETGCQGVAMLAMAAILERDVTKIAEDWVKPISVYKPSNQDFYENKFRIYRNLYPVLKQNFFSHLQQQ